MRIPPLAPARIDAYCGSEPAQPPHRYAQRRHRLALQATPGFATLLLLALAAPACDAQVITTVAGNGVVGFSGDGGPATAASFMYLYDVAVDSRGDVFLADGDGHRIRMVDPAGQISTVVGDGVAGYSGDGGLAARARIGQVNKISVDANDNLFLADQQYSVVRKVSPAGLISTVAGNGTLGFSGDGGAASSAQLANPFGTAEDAAGNLYIGDFSNNRIRKVTATGTISTIAGNGVAGFSGDGGPALDAELDHPVGVAVDAAGNVFIADQDNQRIRRVTATGIISTVAGNGVRGYGGDGGSAINASLKTPEDVAVDSSGTLYIADLANSRIRVVANGIINTFAGNGTHGFGGDGGPAIDAQLAFPYGIGLSPQGSVYIADSDNSRVRKVTTALGDFDGDGKSDVLWRNGTTGADALWRSGVSSTPMPVATVATLSWHVVGKGDFNGDGKADVLWRNASTGANAIWKSAVSSTQQAITGVTNQDWRVAGVGDFDHDGKADVLWRNERTGANTIWKGAVSGQQQATATVGDVRWNVVGIGDFDRDGKSDVLWRNETTGANAIWRSGVSSLQIATRTVTDADWHVVGVGDFDGDGKSDVFWRNASTGADVIWRSGNAATQMAVTGVTSQAWQVAQVGDFNGDGRADMFWRNNSNGANTIWKSAAPSQQQPTTGVTNLAWKVVP